jgi:formylglycine-generating enzyme required for sulfatase activity
MSGRTEADWLYYNGCVGGIVQRRWFISYHSPDRALAERLKAAIERKDDTSYVFFAPINLRAGGFWSAQLAQEIADATAFVLLVGEQGVGPWQVLEYDEALDKRVKSPDFPLILVLLEGQTAPGLHFLRRLHWIVTPDPASDKDVGQLLDVTSGTSTRPGELWRYTSPYRGLAAMEQKDSDYFFGRTKETIEVISSFAANPDKIPILLGNSGVGKSSLAQAGVLAALIRQAWPEAAGEIKAWPTLFRDSRRWCFLTLRPGPEPVRALVEAFIDTWQLDRTSTEWPERRAEWVDKLMSGTLTMRDLLDQTIRRYAELQHPKPASFLVYVDQGEELYVRAELHQRRRFSELLKQGIADPRFHALMSMRSDFLGELQRDEQLYSVHQQINVPPMREEELLELVSKPAVLLSARFESDGLAADIARRAAEESTKDAGALPLLSYLLDDMWKRMVERGDGVLRLPAQSIDLGRVLVDRANAFIDSHPNSESILRRIFTLKLATVREDGEPTRRRAWRSQFSDEEWRLVSELADHPNRLLITVTPETHLAPFGPRISGLQVGIGAPAEEAYAEVAHEAIFRRWAKLRGWIAAEREFLVWRSGLEAARRTWKETPDQSKSDALLMGLSLRQAKSWLANRADDIPVVDRNFIELSRRAMRKRSLRVQALVGVLVFALVGGLTAWWKGPWLKELAYQLTHVHALSLDRVHSLEEAATFKDCDGCPDMVVIPEGTFLMGSPENQGLPRERPQHEVVIAAAFAMSRHEVTFDEWDVCAAHGDCYSRISSGKWERGLQPVINVSWQDAQVYVQWLSRITGKLYRLPTEAEWEYAARAKSQKLYAFGNDDEKLLKLYSWYSENSDEQPHKVETTLKANNFGLYDMHGNVWEWVEDCYRDTYIPTKSDSKAWIPETCGSRVIRGGSFRFGASMVRSASRDGKGATTYDNDRGFRVVRDLAR